MAISNGYATQAEIKDRLDISHTDDDDLIDAAVTAASRGIDSHCNRRFYKDGSVTARVFLGRTTVDGQTYVQTNDFHTTTGLVVKTDTTDNGTFDSTWDSDEYELHPVNGVVGGTEGFPYYELKAVSTKTFPTGGKRSRVQITADWGWDAVPDSVGEACQILSSRILRRKDSPDGITGGFEFEPIRINTRMDPDAVMLLAPFVNPVVAR